MSIYYTIIDLVHTEQKINRSRFITSIKKVKTIDEAKKFITEVGNEHKTANHNCWAYIVGSQGETEHSSDNGEPSGTAGAPMLNSLKKLNMTNVAVVVTRYFGGVKLGIRGLIEAYGSSVEQALPKSKLIPIIPHSYYNLTIPYDFFETLKHRLNEYNPNYQNVEYSADIALELIVESKFKDSVEQYLTDWTQAGRITSVHLKDTDD
ncbi:MAG: YigZ family protein [Candidatus Zophobacter franzmannii]|jgi:uncharacterized YigZ family protein|nr:YigZ family protein [Candidatus Zophobacter franzmannii]